MSWLVSEKGCQYDRTWVRCLVMLKHLTLNFDFKEIDLKTRIDDLQSNAGNQYWVSQEKETSLYESNEPISRGNVI